MNPTTVSPPSIAFGNFQASSSNVYMSGRDQYNVFYPNLSEDEKVYHWLAAVIPSANLNEALAERLENTGSWFMNGNRFVQWKSEADVFLWVHGSPGCGKSVLAASIIEDVLRYCETDQSIAVGYFFFDGRDSQKELQLLGSLIRSLIRQFSAQCGAAPDALNMLYNRCYAGGSQPSIAALQSTLLNILDLFQHVYIVIDSLDECTERKALVNWVKDITDWRKAKLHLLATSRKEEDIFDRLRLLDPDHVEMRPEYVNVDIEMYVDHKFRTDEGLEHWDEEIQANIKGKLLESAEGMFRLVSLQITELQDCFSQDALEEQMGCLPGGLDEFYDRMISRISRKHQGDALKFLQWLSFSARPLLLTEIVQVVGVVDDAEHGLRFKPSCVYRDPRLVLIVCSSLVSYADGIVKLAHMSVKEYLLSQNHRGGISDFGINEQLSHSFIAQTCLTYLLQFNALGFPIKDTYQKFPLADYAARYWTFHIRSGNDDWSDVQRKLVEALFLPHHSPSFFTWIRVFDVDVDWPPHLSGLMPVGVPSTLYYASLVGLHGAVLSLLERGVSVRAQGGSYGNSLQAASYGGHAAVVKCLLENGADLNAPEGKYGNALQAASSQGHDIVVGLLIKNGADVNAHGKPYDQALIAAASHGHDAVVKLLLENGADVDVEGVNYGTALQVASSEGHAGVVKLLLENGATSFKALEEASFEGHEKVVGLLLDHKIDVNIPENYGIALQAASSQGHDGVVKLLVEKGANVNAQGRKYGNALHAASAQGHEWIVKFLLGQNVNVNALGGYYSTALNAASTKGYEEIVRLLLTHGAHVNTPGRKYGNALQAASLIGHEGIVRFLLEKGADVDAQGRYYDNAFRAVPPDGYEKTVELYVKEDVIPEGGYYGTALHAASYNGHESIVKLLLKEGADVNFKKEDTRSALYAASSGGYKEIVKLLLDNGANVNLYEGKYGSALLAASSVGSERIVQLLLDNGADINLRSGDFNTALLVASIYGHEGVVKILLDQGADVNAQGLKHNALQAASHHGYEDVVKLLLDQGADVNAQGSGYNTALHAASLHGHEGVVKLLLNRGGNVNAQYPEHNTALQAASMRGYISIVKLLLLKGADVNIQNEGYYNDHPGYFCNALQAASFMGHEDIAKLLLENGAEINVQGGHYGTALQAASFKGHESVVRLLLENGVDVNKQGGKFVNAFKAASYNGHENIVQLLQMHGGYSVDDASQTNEIVL